MKQYFAKICCYSNKNTPLLEEVNLVLKLIGVFYALLSILSTDFDSGNLQKAVQGRRVIPT